MKRKRESVYILRSIEPETARDGRIGHYVKDGDDAVRCSVMTVGAFSSVAKAEDAIAALVEARDEENAKWGGWERYAGFILDEHYVDDAFFGDGNVSLFESRRTYLPDGRLNCASDADYRCEKAFAGRKEPVAHVKPGDIALMWCGDRLEPVLIGAVAFTESEWKERFKPGVRGDFTDDSGVAFTADGGHEHPFSPVVFPMSCLPHYRPTKKTVSKLEKGKKEYYG